MDFQRVKTQQKLNFSATETKFQCDRNWILFRQNGSEIHQVIELRSSVTKFDCLTKDDSLDKK